MKPTREQIEAWWKEAKIAVLRTDRVVELAYAAGCKAGMEEAETLLHDSVASLKARSNEGLISDQHWMRTELNANTIRAAMEAEK